MDAEDPHFGFYDEFEEEMDNFWKEGPHKPYTDEESDYEEDEGQRHNPSHKHGHIDEDRLGAEEDDAINKLLAEEEAEMLKESGLAEEAVAENIILDRLNVEKLINMLSKVRLVWPENLPHYDENEFSTDPERAKFPESFYHCTDKEKTVMWHTENFRRQFNQLFPNVPKRRPLLIAPKNECGCQKLFPTYINPTVLGYPEFLDCLTCASYMKDFLAPQFLEPPTRVPERTRSHFSVLKDRLANCFEFAVILVSFLIGAGYDAYVVDGYASKTVCTMDTTEDYIEPPEETDEPDLTQIKIKKKEVVVEEDVDSKWNVDFAGLLRTESEDEVIRPTSPSKYRFPKGAVLFSQYEMGLVGEPEEPDLDHEEEEEWDGEGAEPEEQEEEEATGEEEEEEEEEGSSEMNEEEAETEVPTGDETEIGENDEDEDEEEEEEEEELILKKRRPKKTKESTGDKWYGVRNHCWILILPGRRDVEEPFFIEPFTGNKFDILDENFTGIEAVFNQKNYYVNLQDFTEELDDIEYDLNDSSKWGKLLLEHEAPKKNKGDQESLFQDDEDDSSKKVEMLLEMPTSWTQSLDIPQEDYERRYPGGKKTFNYNDAIVELAAPYVNDDGLVKKVLKFQGTGRKPEDLIYILEEFKHRKDKMKSRRWTRQGRILQEKFEKGRRDALKEHVHVSGKNKPTHPRDLFYYANAHPQGVLHRQMIRKGMIEHFVDRDDLLYYRFTSYGGVLCQSKIQEVYTSKAKQFLEQMKGDSSKNRIRRSIAKIVEKYYRDQTKPPLEDIAEKHMLIDEGRIRVLFHYAEGNLTRNSLEFFKPKGVNFLTNDFRPEDCIEYQADKYAPPMDIYRKFKLLQRMETEQRIASVLAVQAEDEVYQTVTSRVQEDWHHEIEPDAFAGDRNDEYIKMKEQKVVDDEEVAEDLSGIDFTTPFFEKFGVPKNKQDEILTKKRIMLNAKVKILKKAHAIRESYERESNHLREKMDWYDKRLEKMTPDQEDDFNNMYKERLFQMHVMEQRLIRHQEISSTKYYNLLLDVLKHPLLNKFSNKKIPPPPPPIVVELTVSEKIRLARELARALDCCQFYNSKYTEPKKEKDDAKKHHHHHHEGEEVAGDEHAHPAEQAPEPQLTQAPPAT